MTKTPRLVSLLLSASLLSGCVVGPNYRQPIAPTATHFKEADGWVPATPADAFAKGDWWTIFNDPVLDALEQRVTVSNQTVAQYFYAYRNAHQLVKEARSSYFPTLSGSAGATYSKSSSSNRTTTTGSGVSTGGTTTTGATGTTTTGATGTTTSGTTGQTSTSTTGSTVISSSGTSAVADFTASLDASWVPDLWGSVRRQVESNTASAQASAADIANERLIVQSELAQDYFQMRVLDDQATLYRDTVAAYNRSLQLTQNQYNAGVAAKSDVITAQSQVLSAQAQLVDTGVVRAQMEHAIAMLVGVAPADLAIAPAPLSRRVPVAPSDVASSLLQRRPDIAGAERRVKAANALIGVQEAAFYPTVTLSASYGYGATNLGDLFNASSSLWSLGSQLADTLIDAGARRAAVRAQRALADEQTAVYRQTVLGAFQTVEDELVALRVLEQEYEVRVQAETAAKQVQQLALNEYRAGLVNYTTVVTDQALALTASQNVLTVLQQRLQASVALVQALGGGWDVKELPKN
jgi:NodT family efflux transporter outer membrane factor (OMF) lipoprotein